MLKQIIIIKLVPKGKNTQKKLTPINNIVYLNNNTNLFKYCQSTLYNLNSDAYDTNFKCC